MNFDKSLLLVVSIFLIEEPLANVQWPIISKIGLPSVMSLCKALKPG